MAPPARSALFPLFSGGPGDSLPPGGGIGRRTGPGAPPGRPATTVPVRSRVSSTATVALAAVLVLGAAAGCSRATSADDAESVDPYSVAASRAAAAGETGTDATDAATDGSADASADASATPSLSPQDEELRRTALSTAAPVRPPGMDDNTPDGAMASARYFVSLYPYVYATGDLTDWRAMSQTDICNFCNSVIDNVTELHGRGGWVDPSAQTITATEYGDPADGYEYSQVRITVDSDPMRRHSGDGTVESEGEAGTSTISFAVKYVDGTWRIGAGEVL